MYMPKWQPPAPTDEEELAKQKMIQEALKPKLADMLGMQTQPVQPPTFPDDPDMASAISAKDELGRQAAWSAMSRPLQRAIGTHVDLGPTYDEVKAANSDPVGELLAKRKAAIDLAMNTPGGDMSRRGAQVIKATGEMEGQSLSPEGMTALEGMSPAMQKTYMPQVSKSFYGASKIAEKKSELELKREDLSRKIDEFTKTKGYFPNAMELQQLVNEGHIAAAAAGAAGRTKVADDKREKDIQGNLPMGYQIIPGQSTDKKLLQDANASIAAYNNIQKILTNAKSTLGDGSNFLSWQTNARKFAVDLKDMVPQLTTLEGSKTRAYAMIKGFEDAIGKPTTIGGQLNIDGIKGAIDQTISNMSAIHRSQLAKAKIWRGSTGEQLKAAKEANPDGVAAIDTDTGNPVLLPKDKAKGLRSNSRYIFLE